MNPRLPALSSKPVKPKKPISYPILLPQSVEDEFCNPPVSKTDEEYRENWEKRKKFRKLQALVDKVMPYEPSPNFKTTPEGIKAAKAYFRRQEEKRAEN